MKLRCRSGFLAKSIIISMVLLVNLVFLWFHHSMSAVGGERELTLDIPRYQTVNQLIERLAQEKIIRSALAAKILVKIEPLKLMEGRYTFRSQDSLRNNLYRNTRTPQKPITIQLLEGEWGNHLARKISQKFPYSETEILRTWNDKQYLETLSRDFPFLRHIPNNPELRIPLEGFFFPDTYFLESHHTLDEITRHILNNTARKYRELGIIERQDLFDLVRMASLVQFEARTESDMRLVAGVFYNRLRIGQKLQASASVCYALGKYQSWTDCEWNIHVTSPYNTYYIEGLPVGPISNPGLQAFRAVLNPQKSDYYYFISDSHGDGKMYFSRTLEEHERLVEKYSLKMKKE